MATNLLIDGYNFIRRSADALFDPSDLEGGRLRLLDELSRYKRERNVRIIVVFDGGGGPSLTRTREARMGVEVVYSKKGETADQVMIEAIRKREAGLLVVTSDRAIIDEAKRHDVPFITTDRLAAALAGARPGDEDEVRTEKKGNPRKAPKGVRRARRTIRKI